MSQSKALNAARMKERNYTRFLSELRITPMTRAQIARQMGLTRAATSLIAEDMLSTGIIQEGTYSHKGRQTSKALSWNRDAFHIAGINLGRDAITAGISDFCGNVFDSLSFPTSECKTAQDAIDRASRYIKEMLETHRPAGAFLGIGVASPGPLDTKAGVVLDPPYFNLMQNVPVADMLRDIFKCDVVLENDANALAMAEKSYGLMDRYERFLELMVDMGIGASLILDGKLNKGPAGFGNGFGHTSIQMNGPRCDCGNNGCVEMYAAIPRIVEAAKSLDPTLSNWRIIVDRAYAGDSTALEIVNSEARYLATVIVNASNALDIQAVIFAGDHILYRPTMILEAIEAEVNRRITSRSERSIHILPSQIPNNAKVLACTNIIIEKYLQRPFMFSNTMRLSQNQQENR